MDPQTLPDRERALYEKIKKNYKIAFEPLQLGDQRLHLLKATDLEQLLGDKDPLKNPSEFPFWIKLWESAMILARFLSGQSDAEGRTLLELGAGLGAPGLAAASAGFQVTLSDYEELIIDFQRVSAAANGLDSIEFMLLDWLNPPKLSRFDVIVGAEILFRAEFFEPLLSLFRMALKPAGVIYLAHDARRKSLFEFLRRAEKDFSIATSKRVMCSEDGDKTILMNRLSLH